VRHRRWLAKRDRAFTHDRGTDAKRIAQRSIGPLRISQLLGFGIILMRSRHKAFLPNAGPGNIQFRGPTLTYSAH
jgi:hypothetical protein